MNLVEGRPVFSGRGQKPSNKDTLGAIEAINKCRQGSFFTRPANRLCSYGWHTKAAARKRVRQARSDALPSSMSSVAMFSSSVTVSSSDAPSSVGPSSVSNGCSSLLVASTSASTSTTVGSGPVPPKFDKTEYQAPTISELRVIGIGTRTISEKLDLLVYCPLTSRCPHCNSALILAN